jgi:hypothetical protein
VLLNCLSSINFKFFLKFTVVGGGGGGRQVVEVVVVEVVVEEFVVGKVVKSNSMLAG